MFVQFLDGMLIQEYHHLIIQKIQMMFNLQNISKNKN